MKIYKLIFFFLLLKILKVACSKKINPWIYDESINLYEILINETKIEIFGEDNLNNCFQGYKIQLECQKETGRLMIKNSNISVNRIVPQIELLNIGDDRYCTKYSDCNIELMETWNIYFQFIIKIKNEKYNDHDQQQLFIIGMDIERIWSLCSFINFNTNYSQILPIFDSLPPRMLTDSDHPPLFNGFTKTQNIYTVSVLSINEMHKNQMVWNYFFNLLKTKTKNEKCRNLINQEIINFTKSPESTLIKLLIKLLLTNCN
ncbi:hypothetical protein ACTFIV_009870 [Dictyostelium citrinum]